MDNEKICKFNNNLSYCSILTNRKTSKHGDNIMRCTGWDDKCKFAKTEQQFADDLDRSIFVCRQKGLCDTCKYTEAKCKLSMEE